MAYTYPVFNVPGLTAAADYQTTSKQYYCVKKNTTDNQVALCTTDGEVFDGVLQNDPASGDAAEVMASGVSKVYAGETLTAGDRWGTNSSGKAKKISEDLTGSDPGDFVMGVVIEGAATNALATVTVGVTTYRKGAD